MKILSFLFQTYSKSLATGKFSCFLHLLISFLIFHNKLYLLSCITEVTSEYRNIASVIVVHNIIYWVPLQHQRSCRIAFHYIPLQIKTCDSTLPFTRRCCCFDMIFWTTFQFITYIYKFIHMSEWWRNNFHVKVQTNRFFGNLSWFLTVISETVPALTHRIS